MRRHLPLFLGYFSVMALSNAIVPVLPAYTPDVSVHGLIYAGYFIGAFIITLPAGILADRYGRIPVIRIGLAISLASGLLLAVIPDPGLVIACRVMEGTGAGLFVAAAMAAVNADLDHVRLSGWLMASQNAGLVSGLAISGLLATHVLAPRAGIAIFTLLLVVPALASLLVREPPRDTGPRADPFEGVVMLGGHYRWLWFSAIILIGITGIATSLYPQHSGAPSDQLGIWLAMMSSATIISVLISSRMNLEPVPVIRHAAILMAGGIVLLFFSPAGFIVIGAVAGVIIIAQMAFLAGIRNRQGTVMGLYASFAYLGMGILPAAAGYLAGGAGFLVAFSLTALTALCVAGTIGRCRCPGAGESPKILPVRENEQ